MNKASQFCRSNHLDHPCTVSNQILWPDNQATVHEVTDSTGIVEHAADPFRCLPAELAALNALGKHQHFFCLMRRLLPRRISSE